ncbi:MAG: DNA polymerase III subunit gamma/tau [Thermodesulfobacteriota bacterium]
MAYLVLARKYRPQTFTEVIEQHQTTQTLMNAIAAGRVAHAILFSGPRGTGKTTIARILAKAMNCEQGPTPTPCNQCRSCREITAGNATDVYEIDGASNNSVDQIRELRGNIKFMPAHSRYKIYIIDEVHMLTASAFNALLKTLEEPPPHVMFEFATTEPHKIPITILSRCQRYDLSYVSLESLVNHLARLCGEEGYQVENRSLELIARESGGSIRDALSLLDQVMSCSGDQLTQDHVVNILGITNRESLFAMSRAALCGDIARILELTDEMYRGGMDIKKLYSELLSHFRDLLIVKLGKNMKFSAAIPSHEVEQIRAQIQSMTEIQLHQALAVLLDEEKTIRYSSQPRIALEMAFIKICQLKPALPVDTLIEKIDALKDHFLNLGNHSSGSLGADTTAGPENFHRPQGREPVLRSPDKPAPDDKTDSPSGNRSRQTDAGDASAHERKPAGAPSSGTADMSHAQAWQAILAVIDDDYPLLAANLRNSALSTIHGDKMEIDVHGSKINMDILGQADNLATLKSICSTFYNRAMDIRLNHKVRPEIMQQPQVSRPKSGVHPLVMDALDIFGGDIVTTKT